MGIMVGSARTLLFLAIVGWCFCSPQEEISSSDDLIQRRSGPRPGSCASSACHVLFQSLGDAVCKTISMQDDMCIQDCIDHNPKKKCYMAFCNNGEQCSMSPEPCASDESAFNHTCTCKPGYTGDGLACSRVGVWMVKLIIKVEPDTCGGAQTEADEIVQVFVNLLVNGDASSQNEASMTTAATADIAITAYPIGVNDYELTMSVFFKDEAEARAAVGRFQTASPDFLTALHNSTITITTAIDASFWGADGELSQPAVVDIPYNEDTVSLTGTTFRPECGGTGSGCWTFDVKMPPKREGTYYALYIPRAEYSSISEDGGVYTAEELETFSITNFPCRVADVDPLDLAATPGATACCLEEFAAKYRPVQGFFDWVEGDLYDAGLDLCGNDCPPVESFVCDNWQAGSTQLANNVMVGMFAGLNYSYVTALEDKTDEVRIYMDENEFKELASQMTEQGEMIYYLTTFIGLAQFKCDGNLILESSALQLTINAEKSDAFAIATHGTELNNFLEYINVRASEIDTWNGPIPEAAGGGSIAVDENAEDITLQWATISFTVAKEFTFDGSAIDMEKIRVGVGTFSDDADWKQPCKLFWPEPNIVADYDRLMDQWCAPDLEYCKAPTSTPEGFVTLHVPLDRNFFKIGEAAGDTSLFVQMEIAVLDSFGRSVVNILSASVPLASSRNRYCEFAGGDAELLEVANADLWVGTVGTQAELDAELIRKFTDVGTDITTPMEPSEIDTKSIESGLMTLVLHGEDGYFNLERSGKYSLELEDVYTIHIMESGDEMYNRVYNLVKGGKAWSIYIDAITRVPILMPSAELSDICSFSPQSATLTNPLPQTCVTRRDMQGRAPRKSRSADGSFTVVELSAGAAGEQAAADFMVTILGDNDFAKELGRNYSNLIVQNQQINGRYRRAWWINPGYEWAPALTRGVSRFMLSQRLIMGALINLNEEGVGSRRMILQSGGGGYFEGIASANLVYAVDPSSLLANILDLSDEQVTTWDIGMQLTESEACMDGAELRKAMREKIFKYLEETASRVKFDNVQIYSVKVDRADVVCRRRASGGSLGRPELRSEGGGALPGGARRVAYSKARGNFETVIAFEPGDRAYLDIKAFSEKDGVLSLAALAGTPEGFAFSEKETVGPLATPTPDGPAWKLIGLVCGCVGGLMFLVLAMMLWMRKKHEDDKEERRAEIVWHRSMRHLEMLKDEIKQEILIERSSCVSGEESSSGSSHSSQSSDSESESGASSSSSSSRSGGDDASEHSDDDRDEPERAASVEEARSVRSGRSGRSGRIMPPVDDHRSETGRSQRSHRSEGNRSHVSVGQGSVANKSQRSAEQHDGTAKSEDDTVEDASRYWLF